MYKMFPAIKFYLVFFCAAGMMYECRTFASRVHACASKEKKRQKETVEGLNMCERERVDNHISAFANDNCVCASPLARFCFSVFRLIFKIKRHLRHMHTHNT